MLFKQIKLFSWQSSQFHSTEGLAERLTPFAFQPCLPSLPASHGFVAPSPYAPDALVQSAKGVYLFCLQSQQKILPAAVLNQAVKEKVQELEATQERKISAKEKTRLKEEMAQTLLPRAFSKLTQCYVLIDTHQQWLLLNTALPAKVEQFLAIFQRALPELKLEKVQPEKVAAELTHWVQTNHCPAAFSVEPAAVLQNTQQQKRIIRCQQQDLNVPPIRSFLHEGYQIQQLALCWHERLQFALTQDFVIRQLRWKEDFKTNVETDNELGEQYQWLANLILTAESVREFLKDLLAAFNQKSSAKTASAETALAEA